VAIATKAQIINDAYSQIRISGITVNPKGNEIELALNRLEDMMAEFDGRNICVDYNFEELPDPDSSSGIERKFNFMAASNLALRLVPDFGKKSANNDSLVLLRKQAGNSLSTASGVIAASLVTEMTYPRRMARGSGNTFRWNHLRRFTQEGKPAPISCDTIQMPLNTSMPIVESWLDQLEELEIITSTIVTFTTGLRQIVAPDISANGKEVSFTVLSTVIGAQEATIEIITDLSTPFNQDVRIVNFNILPNSTLNQ